MLLFKGCSELRCLLAHLLWSPHSALHVQVQLFCFSANRKQTQASADCRRMSACAILTGYLQC